MLTIENRLRLSKLHSSATPEQLAELGAFKHLAKTASPEELEEIFSALYLGAVRLLELLAESVEQHNELCRVTSDALATLNRVCLEAGIKL